MINYGAFQRKYRLTEGFKYARSVRNSSAKRVQTLFIILFVLPSLMFVPVIASSGSPIATLFIVCSVLGLVLSAVAYFYARSGVYKLKMQQFAQDNNFKYLPQLYKDALEGVLFTKGHSKKATNGIMGSYMGKQFALFDYQYTTGSGKNQHTYYHGVMSVQLPKVFPHILLDNRRDSSVGSLEFRRDQRLELEGDFNKTFNVYGPKEYEIEVLQILNPHVMSELLKSPEPVDIEIKGQTLFIYNRGKNNPNSIQSIFTAFELIEQSTARLQKTFTMSEAIGEYTPVLVRSKWPTIIAISVFVLYVLLQILFS